MDTKKQLSKPSCQWNQDVYIAKYFNIQVISCLQNFRLKYPHSSPQAFLKKNPCISILLVLKIIMPELLNHYSSSVFPLLFSILLSLLLFFNFPKFSYGNVHCSWPMSCWKVLPLTFLYEFTINFSFSLVNICTLYINKMKALLLHITSSLLLHVTFYKLLLWSALLQPQATSPSFLQITYRKFLCFTKLSNGHRSKKQNSLTLHLQKS